MVDKESHTTNDEKKTSRVYDSFLVMSVGVDFN